MLKELSSIATGLLGLHGYPLRPSAWSTPREPTIVPRALPRTPAVPARAEPGAPAAALHC